MLVVLTALIALALAAPASAMDRFAYDARIRPVGYSLTPSGSVQIGRIDAALNYTVRITLGGVAQPAQNFAAGDTTRTISVPTLSAGDTVTMEQPTAGAQETFTVPDVSIAGTAGSPTLTGIAPASGPNYAFYDGICGTSTNDTIPVSQFGGAFSVTYPRPLTPGDPFSVTHFPGQGDRVTFESRLPGETPCVTGNAYQYPADPGDAPDPEPFSIGADDLRATATTGARIVLRRGGATLVDYSNPAATLSISKHSNVQPLPGDSIELYRPHTAGAPSTIFTVPSIRSTYDTSNSLVAVDGPAAASLQFRVGSQFAMWQNSRGALNTAPGRTLFNFAASDGISPAISLFGREILTTEWTSADGHNEYTFGASPGDLASPVLRLKLASKFRLAKIRTSLTASLTSSEIVSTSFKLTLPAKLKTSASGNSSPRTLATRKLSVGAGTTKVKLKMTKSAKKLFTKLKKGKYPAQKATLTVTATDPSGNSATTVKTTKLVRK